MIVLNFLMLVLYRFLVSHSTYFGEIECILEERIRSSSVLALTDCEMHSVSRKDLMALVEEYPEVGAELKNMALHRIGDHQLGSIDRQFPTCDGVNNINCTDIRQSSVEMVNMEKECP